ncbi:5-(carboxyamino)imidazole ribonucleotide synthase [Ampullimonas aquatilis]|uniref:5-(carboxyamino)imidazole ribonucleotide synthase n=1 Tax=Ampullimonas aquatilis TaxID=1341549 RepID=UPI003C78D41C
MTELLMKKNGPVLPGQWLGVMGGGQLARMFCFSAQSMGYKVAVLDPDASSPAGRIAEKHICAAYDDAAALQELAALCQAVTTEFENVPAESMKLLAQQTFVSPRGECVAITQDRAREKAYIHSCGIDVAPHKEILNQADLADVSSLLPGILKSSRLGYDGKGQVRVSTPAEVLAAFKQMDQVPCVLEQRLDLAYELSVLVARGVDGDCEVYPVQQNEHRDGILHQTIVPAPLADDVLCDKAQQAAQIIAANMDYVGVLCVEFFVLKDGTLLVNEMAPRPHNSGHHTINSCAVSQFEQQVRAMARLPLGVPYQHSTAVMINLLGDLWFDDETEQEPAWNQVLAIPNTALHLYGKSEPRKGRKMGHITCTSAESLEDALAYASEVVHFLGLT